MPDEPAIFISYRRRDAGGHGRALHEYLSGRFGDDRVFFDRSTIESGDKFPDRLRRGVEGCAALLALIGAEWLDVRGDGGGRRLDDADDFVRREIALAFEQGKKVIPVLFDDTAVPPPDRLPDPLAALATCDALTLRGKTYEYRTQRRELVRLLAKVPGMPEPLPEAGEAAAAIPAGLPALIEAATRPLQQLNQEQRETIRVLERQLGAGEAQLRAFFQIIGEAQVPAEQQPARLAEIAEQYRQLRAQVAALPGDAPEVARLKDAARAALDAGRLQQADDLLVRWKRRRMPCSNASSAKSSDSKWNGRRPRRSAQALHSRGCAIARPPSTSRRRPSGYLQITKTRYSPISIGTPTLTFARAMSSATTTLFSRQWAATGHCSAGALASGCRCSGRGRRTSSALRFSGSASARAAPAPGGGGGGLPRGAAGVDPRAGAAGLGQGPEQPRRRAFDTR
jgi:hypothetical protein